MSPSSLTFGIYPGGIVGTPTGLSESKPDSPAKINHALDELQGSQATFLVRSYLHFAGKDSPASAEDPHPADAAQYAIRGRRLNLVLCYRDPAGDMEAWRAFVRDRIRSYAGHLSTLSVTLEPNLQLPNVAVDGNFPAVQSALIEGVAVAREEIDRARLPVALGFCAGPTFGPNAGFWAQLASEAGEQFSRSLDYVGLDFYVDVFYPVAPDGQPGDVRDSVRQQLLRFREVDLACAGIPPTTAIHIGENGWPTSSARSPARQAEVLECVLQTMQELRGELNVTHYQWFSLRDSNSSRDEIFSQFGLLRDDYQAKPAFDTYRQLIAELGA
jgi:hypothetical protein